MSGGKIVILVVLMILVCVICVAYTIYSAGKEKVDKRKNAAGSGTEKAEELQYYKEMYENGVITKREFEKKKSEISGLK